MSIMCKKKKKSLDKETISTKLILFFTWCNSEKTWLLLISKKNRFRMIVFFYPLTLIKTFTVKLFFSLYCRTKKNKFPFYSNRPQFVYYEYKKMWNKENNFLNHKFYHILTSSTYMMIMTNRKENSPRSFDTINIIQCIHNTYVIMISFYINSVFNVRE